jgi:hypothetical protein
MAHSIFRRIAPPFAQARWPINVYANWHTWSLHFRAFLREAADELRRLNQPPLVHVAELNDYDQTFSWAPTKLADRRLRAQFLTFARSLYATRPHHMLMLFDDLIGPDLDAEGLHALFALLRGAMIGMTWDKRAAMYSPLGDVSKRGSDFPLHADLYIPQILFNVFNNVPKNRSGASTFLPVAVLRELISHVPSLPAIERKRIIRTIQCESSTDRFDIVYDLLHGRHKWVRELETAMKRRQLLIKLHAGQGYMLHDRVWLHGRQVPQGGIPANRVHRLVFGLPSE